METEQNTSIAGGEVTSENTNIEATKSNDSIQSNDKELLNNYLKSNSKSDNGQSDLSSSKDKPVKTDDSAVIEKQKKGSRAQERIGELTRKYEKSKNELARLQQEFEEYRKNNTGIKREDTKSEEEYINKVVDDRTNTANMQNELKNKQREMTEARNSLWTNHVREQVSDYNKFIDRYNKFTPIINKHDTLTAEYTLKSPVGPKMLEDLYSRLDNPEFGKIWFTMPNAKKSYYLVELEKFHSANPNAKSQTQSTGNKINVPKPIVPGDGAHASSGKSDKDLLASYMNGRRK